MPTPNQFRQLVDILPQLESFAIDHQLTSLSLIKNPFDLKPGELFLCYTQPSGKIHGLDTMAQIGQDFKELWGVQTDADIVIAIEQSALSKDLFEEHLQQTQLFLVTSNNNEYVTATADQVVDYVKRDFGMTIQVTDNINLAYSSKKRRLSDEKKATPESALTTTNNFFTPVTAPSSETSIDEQIEKLSLDECKEYLKTMSRQFGVSNLIQIRPARK
jgi:hypothetical protein